MTLVAIPALLACVYRLYFFLIAIGAFVFTFLEVSLIVRTTETQLYRVRSAYVHRLLTLDTAWFDTHKAGECVTRLADASASMGTGMTKVATLSRYCSTLLTGVVIGFVTSWKLTLVIFCCAPLFALALSVLVVTAISSERRERTAYARAGDVANEVFSLIRAVSAYGGERHEVSRYTVFLRAAEAAGIRKGAFIGACVGFMLLTFYMTYGISCWCVIHFGTVPYHLLSRSPIYSIPTHCEFCFLVFVSEQGWRSLRAAITGC